ncbi:MAG: ROK family protein [bacterium]|nr:ROK family protein [bacterium]
MVQTKLPNITHSIGVDIGGTKMSAVLFDLEKNEIIADYQLATPKDNLDNFLVMLWALIDPLIEKAKKEKFNVGRVGIGVAGVVDQPPPKNLEGKILDSPNLKIINNVSLGKIVFEKYGLPVVMDNDANCFLLAETKLGAVKNYASAVGVTLGTGIGGAFTVNHEIFHGVHGSAGEIGAMIVDVVEDVPHTLEEMYHNLTQANPELVAAEAYEGDELAGKVYEEVGRFIGLTLASMINIVDPEIIVIGGSVMKSSGLFMTEIKKNLKAEILSPKLKKIKIVAGKVERAGAVGAALLSPSM